MLDTLGVISICLIIDLLAPLSVYFLIRKNEEELVSHNLTFIKRILRIPTKNDFNKEK